jgi:hypothetical protein
MLFLPFSQGKMLIEEYERSIPKKLAFPARNAGKEAN